VGAAADCVRRPFIIGQLQTRGESQAPGRLRVRVDDDLAVAPVERRRESDEFDACKAFDIRCGRETAALDRHPDTHFFSSFSFAAGPPQFVPDSAGRGTLPVEHTGPKYESG
jgi:hypothetical protein